MPSRPRPAGRVRRGIASYAPYLRRRASRRTRSDAGPGAAPGAAINAAPGAAIDPAIADAAIGPFAERRAKLPIATLLPHRSEGRQRVLTSSLHRWMELRWMWVQPRLVPLIVAFFGLLGVLNARRYLIGLAHGDGPIAGYIEPGPGAAVAPDLPSTIHETAIDR